MIRSLMAGAAAVALLTGAAYAQDSTYYSRRTETVTTPFGASQTTTTTTSQAPADADVDVEPPPPPLPPVAEAPPPAYDEESADIGEPPPPGDYDRTMTTRHVGPDGMAMDRTDRYRQRRTFYDSNEELGARTTTTQTHSRTYGPAPVYVPNSVAAGPAPHIDLPPYRRQTTTTTTTTEDDGE